MHEREMRKKIDRTSKTKVHDEKDSRFKLFSAKDAKKIMYMKKGFLKTNLETYI